jgi:hypothetical protein
MQRYKCVTNINIFGTKACVFVIEAANPPRERRKICGADSKIWHLFNGFFGGLAFGKFSASRRNC